MLPKLEMMFKDNKRSAQCQLTQFASLTKSEILKSRLLVERQYTPYTPQPFSSLKSSWLADIETLMPSVEALLQFSQAIGPHPGEWDDYNAQLSHFYELHENYLKAKRDYDNLLGRTAALELKILNAGEVIARDLLVSMCMPKGILLYSEQEYPKKPVEPQPPEKPAPIYEKMLNDNLAIQRAEASIGDGVKEEMQVITDLNIQQTEGYDVRFPLH
jgi:hypothetical protein